MLSSYFFGNEQTIYSNSIGGTKIAALVNCGISDGMTFLQASERSMEFKPNKYTKSISINKSLLH